MKFDSFKYLTKTNSPKNKQPRRNLTVNFAQFFHCFRAIISTLLQTLTLLLLVLQLLPLPQLLLLTQFLRVVRPFHHHISAVELWQFKL